MTLHFPKNVKELTLYQKMELFEELRAHKVSDDASAKLLGYSSAKVLQAMYSDFRRKNHYWVWR